LLSIEILEKWVEFRHNTATSWPQQGHYRGQSLSVSFADIVWRQRPVRVEHQWLAPDRATSPLLVFLHEGLGSLSMWRDFPQRLCDAAGCRGLVYSRPGYGRSTPRAADEHWQPDFMHQQALDVLPALLQALAVEAPVWLFGHSDGGSIALLHAARFHAQVAGVVVMAPHIVVEDLSVASIERTRLAYLQTDLRSKLARHHDDPDSAFWGWNRIWLDPAFRSWCITNEIKTIRCPLLAMQGLDDEYGTLAQVHGIAVQLPHTQLLELPACGHSPHRDQADAVIAATVSFMRAHNAHPAVP
jgi:pimeloyl-ACP methyl ester carboxylesterase